MKCTFYVRDLYTGYYIGYGHTLVRHHFFARPCPSISRACKVAKLAASTSFDIRRPVFFGLFTRSVQYIPGAV